MNPIVREDKMQTKINTQKRTVLFALQDILPSLAYTMSVIEGKPFKVGTITGVCFDKEIHTIIRTDYLSDREEVIEETRDRVTKTNWPAIISTEKCMFNEAEEAYLNNRSTCVFYYSRYRGFPKIGEGYYAAPEFIKYVTYKNNFVYLREIVDFISEWMLTGMLEPTKENMLDITKSFLTTEKITELKSYKPITPDEIQRCRYGTPFVAPEQPLEEICSEVAMFYLSDGLEPDERTVLTACTGAKHLTFRDIIEPQRY